jgi:hypothetical protein
MLAWLYERNAWDLSKMNKAPVGLLLVLCGCGIPDSKPDRLAWDPQDLAAKESTTIALAKLAVVDYSALTAELQVSPEIKLGQPVRFELVVTNNADQPVWLSASTAHAHQPPRLLSCVSSPN